MAKTIDVNELIERFIDAAINFSQDSSEWGAMDSRHFYSTHPSRMWYESSDNDVGGLDLSWAFHLSEDEIRENAQSRFKEEFDSASEIFEAEILDDGMPPLMNQIGFEQYILRYFSSIMV